MARHSHCSVATIITTAVKQLHNYNFHVIALRNPLLIAVRPMVPAHSAPQAQTLSTLLGIATKQVEDDKAEDQERLNAARERQCGQQQDFAAAVLPRTGKKSGAGRDGGSVPSRRLPQMKLSQIELIYRAEGNANLVLALPGFKKVLRLPKMVANRKGNNEEQEHPDQQQQQEYINTSVMVSNRHQNAKVENLTMEDFAAYVEIIRQLLGNEFIPAVNVVWLPDEEDKRWLNQHISTARPAQRRNKEFCGQFGLLLPDATLLPSAFDALLTNLQATTAPPLSGNKLRTDSETIAGAGLDETATFAFEIKPKQGWLLPADAHDLFNIEPTATTANISTTTKAESAAGSGSAAVQPAARAMTRQHTGCRYCAMQYLKLRAGKICKLGTYCPIELFSGAADRMEAALDALLACPQNNMRIFRNGVLIYGDHPGSLSWQELRAFYFPSDEILLIKHLLLTCLLKNYQQPQQQQQQQQQWQQWQQQQQGQDVAARTATVLVTARSEDEAASLENGSCRSGTKTIATPFGARAVDVEKAVTAGQPHTTATPTAAMSAAAAMAGQAGEQQQQRRQTKLGRISKPQQRGEAAATTITTRVTRTGTPPAPGTIGTAGEAVVANVIPSERTSGTGSDTSGRHGDVDAPEEFNEAEMLSLPKNCVLRKILDLQLLVKRNLRCMRDAGAATRHLKSYAALKALMRQSRDNLSSKRLAPAEEYLLGATALDCSIMIAYKQLPQGTTLNANVNNPHLVYLSAYDKYFLTSVTLLDLDPKPDSHFCKYALQTSEAFRATE